MNFLSVKRIALRRLRLPGSFRPKLREPGVVLLSKHIDEKGLFLPVLVRKSDGRVLDGFDRVAAHFVLKREDIWCLLCECTDEEAALIEMEVNVARRHDPARAAKTLEAIDSIAATIEPPKVKTPGRPLSKRGVARKKVADALGVSVHAVKSAEYREKRKRGEKREVRPIKTLGMTLPETLLKNSHDLGSLFDEAAIRAQQALACLTEVESRGLPYSPSRLQRLRRELQEMAGVIRNARPDSVCPYCRAIPAICAGCQACRGAGMLTVNEMANIPAALLDEQVPKVMVGGQLKSVWDFLPPPQPQEEADVFGLGA